MAEERIKARVNDVAPAAWLQGSATSAPGQSDHGRSSRRFRGSVASPKWQTVTLERSSAADDLVDEDNGGNDEQQVNQRPTHVDDEKPCQPQDHQDDDESPEHGNLLGCTAVTENLL